MRGKEYNHHIAISIPSISWALDSIMLKALSLPGYKGTGIRIGHLDSGIHPEARDLIKSLELSCDFVAQGNPNEKATLTDDTGHGTRTASLMVGGSRSRTYIGVAPEAKLVSGKVLEGGDAVVRILKGLDWLGEKKVPIALLCAGLPNTNPVFAPMMRSLRKEGMLLVCPIGNTGNGHFLQPGDDASVLSVGAIDKEGQVPGFSGSRHGRFSTELLAPDILAPGVAVPCATRRGNMAPYSGTSMAAALVAGVAALLLEAEPDASADALYDALCYGSSPLSDHSKKHARSGILDAELALAYLKKQKDQVPKARPIRPPIVKPGWKDPRLLYHLSQTNAEAELRAVYIILPEIETENWESQARNFLYPYLTSENSSTAEFLPRGKAVILKGNPTIHQQILKSPELTYASAADAGRLLVPNKTIFSI